MEDADILREGRAWDIVWEPGSRHAWNQDLPPDFSVHQCPLGISVFWIEFSVTCNQNTLAKLEEPLTKTQEARLWLHLLVTLVSHFILRHRDHSFKDAFHPSSPFLPVPVQPHHSPVLILCSCPRLPVICLTHCYTPSAQNSPGMRRSLVNVYCTVLPWFLHLWNGKEVLRFFLRILRQGCALSPLLLSRVLGMWGEGLTHRHCLWVSYSWGRRWWLSSFAPSLTYTLHWPGSPSWHLTQPFMLQLKSFLRPGVHRLSRPHKSRKEPVEKKPCEKNKNSFASKMPPFSSHNQFLTLQKVPFLSTPMNKALLEMWVQKMRIK